MTGRKPGFRVIDTPPPQLPSKSPYWEEWQAIIDECRRNPGKLVEVDPEYVGLRPNNLGSVSTAIKQGRRTGFHPEGAWDAYRRNGKLYLTFKGGKR